MVLNVYPLFIKSTKNKISIIVKYNDNNIGHCIFQKTNSTDWIIKDIYIQKDFRYFKIGTKLIHTALFLTKFKLIYELNLKSDNSIVSFLLKLGFIKIGDKLIPDIKKIELKINPNYLLNIKSNKIKSDYLIPILSYFKLVANNNVYTTKISLSVLNTIVNNKLNIKITKDPGKHNWKKIHQLIVKDTPLSSFCGFSDSSIDLTNFYIYDLITNKPIGYFILGFTTEYHRFFGLEFMGVLPKYRCKGIGSEIIKFSKKYAKKQGYKRLFAVFIKSEEHIKRLNERNGFIYENTYVDLTLENNQGYGFCPIAYYNKHIKNKQKVKRISIFDIMYSCV